jgi:23S rRNA (cytidine1920-2'-O)/16S rRNA (cytidine1409-2'-O)-methyltransferase
MPPKPRRTRLDLLLVERGLADSQQKAQAMILAGEISVDNVPAQKAGVPTPIDSQIQLTSRHQKYASRGGLKLEGALQDFAINPSGLICLDVGASTGGFTDCLLQHNAAKIYAVDVNIAQLNWTLQHDPRVIPIEQNARDLNPSDIPNVVDLVVADVSFISVCKILSPAAACAKPNANFLILIKPQFELRREDIPAGGIVEDPRLHEKAIAAVRHCAEQAGLTLINVLPSRLTGAEGNQEFFLHARKAHLK